MDKDGIIVRWRITLVIKTGFCFKKWLGTNPSIELHTPNHYLIDFIELSNIRQEEAIDSLQGYNCSRFNSAKYYQQERC